METGKYCAYNVTRNVLLSDRVTVAEAALGSLQILGLVMHGPGAHQESAVWLTGFSRPPDLPRLATFDILYLDESNGVITCGNVGPDTDYPELHERASSALILADQRLAATATSPGDQLRICTQEELAAVVKAASQPAVENRDQSAAIESDRPLASVAHFEVIRTPTYFFEPFVGTLMYLPEFPEAQPSGTEIFLPQSESSTPPAAVDEAVEAPSVVSQSPAQPKMPPGLIPIEEPLAKTPARKRARKPPDAKEPPTFAHPEPVRFFDPAAAASETGDALESSVLPEPTTPRPGTPLPPELKSAIIQLDELHRQKQSPNQEPVAKKKPVRPKSPREQVEPVSTGPAEAAAIPKAELTAGPNLTKTSAESGAASPQSTRPDLAPPIAVPAPASFGGAAVEPPPIPSPADLQAQSPTPPEAVKPSRPVSVPEKRPEPVLKPPPSEPLSALAETADEIGLIEASLSDAAVEAEPEIPTTTIRPVFGKTELAPMASAMPAAQPAPAKRIEEQPAVPDEEKTRKREKPQKPKLPLGTRILRWLDANPLDGKRRGERVHQPGLVAFYWSGGAPRPHEIANISKSGFYLRTREFWSLNTLVRMTLQRPSPITQDRESISVLARVVRIDDEGVGHEFVTTEDLMALRGREIVPESGTDRTKLESFLGLK